MMVRVNQLLEGAVLITSFLLSLSSLTHYHQGQLNNKKSLSPLGDSPQQQLTLLSKLLLLSRPKLLLKERRKKKRKQQQQQQQLADISKHELGIVATVAADGVDASQQCALLPTPANLNLVLLLLLINCLVCLVCLGCGCYANIYKVTG